VSKLKLRSNDFEISKQENEVIVKTTGFGHGVGMSQYGAEGMAEEGYQYDEILKHYYIGIEIKAL
jgi:stage II sporulation protein D